MIQVIRERVIVEREGVIEVRHPELATGTQAEIIVLIEQPAAEMPPLASFVGKGKGCFANAAEVDAFLRGERDDWEPCSK
ncbi:MAG TPA: hypothetical protein VF173_00125 [Thermoanaerobaculia bacterium]|nr:hypothetical protein [Thermoanaerobaculia bacterium]